MERTNKEHVATTTEEMQLLPIGIVAHAQNVALTLGLETTWLVDEDTGTIERGSVVDTVHDKYFTFEVFRSEDAPFEMMPTSEWLPCEND